MAHFEKEYTSWLESRYAQEGGFSKQHTVPLWSLGLCRSSTNCRSPYGVSILRISSSAEGLDFPPSSKDVVLGFPFAWFYEGPARGWVRVRIRANAAIRGLYLRTVHVAWRVA